MFIQDVLSSLSTIVQVFRQRNPEFVRMLNDIRTGNGTAAIQQLLKQCTRPLPEQHGVKPTQLFSRNADVDTVNAAELKALKGEEVSNTFVPLYQACIGVLPPLARYGRYGGVHAAVAGLLQHFRLASHAS